MSKKKHSTEELLEMFWGFMKLAIEREMFPADQRVVAIIGAMYCDSLSLVLDQQEVVRFAVGLREKIQNDLDADDRAIEVLAQMDTDDMPVQ